MEKGLCCGINQPQGGKGELEKVHVPVICVPERAKAGEPIQVTVRVGKEWHPMEEGHHIQWVELYSKSNFLTRVDLTPVFTRPEVTVTLVKGALHKATTLRAVARCNLHGMWEGETELRVL